MGIAVASYNVLLLPLDVANQRGSFVASGGLDMALLEFIMFMVAIFIAIAVVPFSMFFYEGMDEAEDQRFVLR
jgi:LMBR1 domain-containing protein 1